MSSESLYGVQGINVICIFSVESMSRFQHRQLELHPSEAISHRDFDPFLALSKQRYVRDGFVGCFIFT